MRLPYLPILASEHGAEVDAVLGGLFLFLFLVFLSWLAFFVLIIVRFRAGRGQRPSSRPFGLPLPYLMAGIMAVVELGIVLLLSLPFWERYVEASEAPPRDALHIRVVAQQYLWNVHYPGADGVFGKTDVALIDDLLNPIGLDGGDPAGRDDIVQRGIMHLPVGRPVTIRLTSKDVVHAFTLPEFRVKRDAIPGMAAEVRFTPAMTTQELREAKGNPERDFEIVCSQLCGLGHYRMKGILTVDTPEAFEAWLAEKAPNPDEAYDDFWDE